MVFDVAHDEVNLGEIGDTDAERDAPQEVPPEAPVMRLHQPAGVAPQPVCRVGGLWGVAARQWHRKRGEQCALIGLEQVEMVSIRRAWVPIGCQQLTTNVAVVGKAPAGSSGELPAAASCAI
eukprot:gene50441-57827_t